MSKNLTKRAILKKSAQFGIITFVSRITGIIREILKIRFLGVGAISDAFIIALKIPHFLRESGESMGLAFENFSNCAQRLGVYTSQDYIDIFNKLNQYWELEAIRSLSDEAQKARDYLLSMPDRLQRIAERMKLSEDQFRFKWVEANGML